MKNVKHVYAKKSLYQEISIKVPDNPEQKINSAEEIREWLLKNIAQKVNVDFNQIDDQEEFSRYVSSLEAMEVLGDLEKKLDRRLTPTIVINYPNIAMLAEHFGGEDKAFSRH